MANTSMTTNMQIFIDICLVMTQAEDGVLRILEIAKDILHLINPSYFSFSHREHGPDTLPSMCVGIATRVVCD